MPSREATIGSIIGLHARPATEFCRAVAASGVPITIGRPGGTRVNGAAVLAVMALGIRCGERVVITTDEEDAEAVLDNLASFLEAERAVETTPSLFASL